MLMCMWQPIANAPYSRTLELAVLDDEGMHPLIFPCERAPFGWRNAVTRLPVDVHPTHWRDWIEVKTEAKATPDPA